MSKKNALFICAVRRGFEFEESTLDASLVDTHANNMTRGGERNG